MALHFQLNYTSRLARHRHILWTADQYANSQVSVPDFKKALALNLALSSFNHNMAPLKYGRFYPSQILKPSINKPAGLFRVTGIGGTEFTADFNHPLAGKDITLEKSSLQNESPVIGKPQMRLE